MGHALNPSDVDPMDFMKFMVAWPTVEIPLNPYGDWQEVMHQLTVSVSSILDGRFFVMLAREDEMTDDIAYYSVHCEDQDDAEGVAMFYMGSVLKPGREVSPPGPTPEWLRNFAKT